METSLALQFPFKAALLCHAVVRLYWSVFIHAKKRRENNFLSLWRFLCLSQHLLCQHGRLFNRKFQIPSPEKPVLVVSKFRLVCCFYYSILTLSHSYVCMKILVLKESVLAERTFTVHVMLRKRVKCVWYYMQWYVLLWAVLSEYFLHSFAWAFTFTFMHLAYRQWAIALTSIYMVFEIKDNEYP